MPKETCRSFGSLAALAVASILPPAQAGVVLSPISNLALPTLANDTVHFDIDGNGADDFTLSFDSDNSTFLDLLAADSNNGIAVDADTPFAFTLGGSVSSSATYDTAARMWDGTGFWAGPGIVYAGVRFRDTLTQSHYGWLRFNLPDNDPANGVLEAAAWESIPDTAITISAVPEPASVAAAAGLGLLGWAAVRRRSRLAR